jgi:hypothetical protein
MVILKSCFILGFLVLLLYTVYIVWKDKRIPYSISSTVYSLEKKNRIVFTLVMFTTAMLITPWLFEIMSGTDLMFLSLFTSVGLLGVGADPLVYNEKNIMHYASAILMGVSSQFIVWVKLPWLMTLWIPYIIYTMYMDDGRWNMMFAEAVMMTVLAIVGLI